MSLRMSATFLPCAMQREKRDMVAWMHLTTLFGDTKVAAAIRAYCRGCSTLLPGKSHRREGAVPQTLTSRLQPCHSPQALMVPRCSRHSVWSQWSCRSWGLAPPGHVSRGAAGVAHRALCGTCSAVSSLVVSCISYSPTWERKARGLLTQPRSGERAPHSTARNTSRGHLTWHVCLVIRQGVTFSEVPGQVEDRSLHSQVASSNPHPLEDGVKGAKGGNANALRADETNRVVR